MKNRFTSAEFIAWIKTENPELLEQHQILLTGMFLGFLICHRQLWPDSVKDGKLPIGACSTIVEAFASMQDIAKKNAEERGK